MHNSEQLKAADPNQTIWVSASAGTGKTKILTDRVLRLLIKGVNANKILCITYTKAAAKEMEVRLQQKLFTWHQLDEECLMQELQILYGRQPENIELQKAKNLYQLFIDGSDKLQIQTIHSFCQNILGKFCHEASLQANFRIIDEIESKKIIKELINEVIANHKILNRQFADAVMQTATMLHESIFDELIEEIIFAKIKFIGVMEKFPDADCYKKYLQKLLLQKPLTEQEVLAETLRKIPVGLSDEKIDLEYQNAINNKKEDNEIFKALQKFFLTNAGKIKVKFTKAKLSKDISEVANLIYESDQKLKNIRLIVDNVRLYILAANIITSYDIYKKELNVLDYDDLILHTRNLLATSEFKEWVAYKLDGWLDHVLIDEAQDTAPEQWDIIKLIIEDFFVVNDSDIRSIFIVGDHKQSIYSFQGSDVITYQQIREMLKQRISEISLDHHFLDLQIGYRSVEAINDFVGMIQSELSALGFVASAQLNCYREKQYGHIEIWPLIERNDKAELFWPEVADMTEVTQDQLLAEKIVKYIKNLLSSDVILPSTGMHAKPGDITILVQKRNELCNSIIKKLDEYQIDNNGIDKVYLAANLSIKDIMAIAKFVLQPLDDLNLATILKSPFIGVSELELQKIIAIPGEYLWHKLADYQDQEVFNKLNQFLQIDINYSLYDFFFIIIISLGNKERLLNANGLRDKDIIDEFLDVTLSFSKKEGVNLHDFVDWFEKSNIHVKRSINQAAVNIMTVHGAKGLQAPIIILADANNVSTLQDKIVWEESNLFWWQSSSQGGSSHYYQEQRDKLKNLRIDEYWRLFYVAATRAEDILIIAGKQNHVNKQSWYEISKKALSKLSYGFKRSELFDQEIMTYEQGQIKSMSREKNIGDIVERQEQENIKPLIELLDVRSVEPSQFNFTESKAILYGHIFHKLLEYSFQNSDLSKSEKNVMLKLLPLKQRKTILDKISLLWESKEVKELLAGEVLTEVSIGVKNNGDKSIGRIDLLAITPEKITIIDYKTDSKPATNLQELPAKYKKQIEFYRQAISAIYQGKKVEVYILWLENLKWQKIV